jgi:hypothetical protein
VGDDRPSLPHISSVFLGSEQCLSLCLLLVNLYGSKKKKYVNKNKNI